MAAKTAFQSPVGIDIDEAFVVVRGEFLPDDLGLVSSPPPIGIAAGLVSATIIGAALVVFAVSEIAGRYAARPRGAR